LAVPIEKWKCSTLPSGERGDRESAGHTTQQSLASIVLSFQGFALRVTRKRLYVGN